MIARRMHEEPIVVVGDRLRMPYTPFEVVVLEVAWATCGHQVFRFRDPVVHIDCWAHAIDFTDPGPMPKEPYAT